jgi:integrating conjugative element protein (TIGR03759 family)
MVKQFFAVVLSVSVIATARAAEINYSRVEGSQAQYDSTEKKETDFDIGQRFGLTQEEWARYEDLMKGEGRFHWSHLDPVWVLTIYAESEAERQRFARLAAKQEYERTNKMRLAGRAYVDNFQDMYGSEPLIDLEDFKSRYQERRNKKAMALIKDGHPDVNKELNAGDRIVLFLSTKGCPACNNRFQKLSGLQKPGISLDLHFIGDTTDAVHAWAQKMGIAPSDIEGRHITLNTDREMYQRYGTPPLPAAFYYDSAKDTVSLIQGDTK